MKRDFLKLSDLSTTEHGELYARAVQLKNERKAGRVHQTLSGKTLACVFEKASTRTRLSFEAAMLQMGGRAIILNSGDSQMARGEPITDTARVTSSYVDAIMFRTFGDERLTAFAKASSVPVINGLSEGGHPVQLLADLMTVRERHGSLSGVKAAWVGDASSNMALSWIEAVSLFGFELRIAAPEGYRPAPSLTKGLNVHVTGSPEEAVKGANVVTTDVWTSMGQEKETAARKAALAPYQVNAGLMAHAASNAIVLHCLPAHRGEEITGDVLEGPQSAVFDEAENRMHAQKALLEKLLVG